MSMKKTLVKTCDQRNAKKNPKITRDQNVKAFNHSVQFLQIPK